MPLVIERAGSLRGAGVDLFARWVGDGGPTVVVLHGGPGGGRTLVGEAGPEIVNLPAGSSVTPAYDAPGAMGKSVTIGNVNINNGMDFAMFKAALQRSMTYG